MRAQAERFGMPSPPKRIIATGGASTNKTILKAIASIFGCAVCTVQRPGIYPRGPSDVFIYFNMFLFFFFLSQICPSLNVVVSKFLPYLQFLNASPSIFISILPTLFDSIVHGLSKKNDTIV